MASFAMSAMANVSKAVTIQDTLSGIFGSISMTAWIFVLLPQLIANYKAQSADGLSMTFLITWLIGDATNLIGALLTELAPSAIALAVYFCFIDFALIAQATYYNRRNSRRAEQLDNTEREEPAEDSPLLGRRRSSSAELPGSQVQRSESPTEPLRKLVSGESPASKETLHNTLSVLGVCLIGVVGWFLSFKAGAWDRKESPAPANPDHAKSVAEIVGLALGYTSAALYLCARIPQIIKNYREKSCEGLAVLFFILSIMGNLFYGASLVAYSQDKTYLITTIPWLIGSIGTISEDVAIFVQFRLYKDNRRHIISHA